MLDQNGVSGMLVANLHIAPSLNLCIQDDIVFDNIHSKPEDEGGKVEAKKIKAPRMTILE